MQGLQIPQFRPARRPASRDAAGHPAAPGSARGPVCRNGSAWPRPWPAAPGSAGGSVCRGERRTGATPGQSPGLQSGRPCPAAAWLSRGPDGRGGFTLTELLIVIAIIGVLASLIAVAAKAALDASARNAIVLEIKNVSGAMENFKNDLGAFPPILIHDGSSARMDQVATDAARMAKRAFPRINAQELQVFEALAGRPVPILNGPPLQNGLGADEALVFWLRGFSDDPQFPLSGPGGPSFLVADGEVLESRTWRYQFDLGRLGPRTDDQPDVNAVRSVQYTINVNGVNQQRAIRLWTFRPKGSEQPLVYFDVSRYKPRQYDPPARFSGPLSGVTAVKKLREGRTVAADLSDFVFANLDKFQILHCGLDDDWGNFGSSASGSGVTVNDILVFPEGPYIGPNADTLTNFTDGTLEQQTQ
ncbi:MAG TPA: prepilin-type N-terminal cleavage/methylation domain-containing protein [Lacipirellulaceae bacterium]|nr:prepilin-type N-terminal cleavage/methylation domain-containing protein [Lacipirellulaceae bacterium]